MTRFDALLVTLGVLLATVLTSVDTVAASTGMILAGAVTVVTDRLTSADELQVDSERRVWIVLALAFALACATSLLGRLIAGL